MAESFDFEEFRKTKYVPRELTLDLANFGDTGQTKTWHYTGLTAADMAEVDEVTTGMKRIEQIADAAVKASNGNAGEILKAMGLGERTPISLARRYVIFERGSIDPTKPKNRPETVKFANAFPVEFRQITDAIWSATAMGQSAKKKQSACGETAVSEQTSALPDSSDSHSSD